MPSDLISEGWTGTKTEPWKRRRSRDVAPEILKKYDLNGDGALDRSEFKAAGWLLGPVRGN